MIEAEFRSLRKQVCEAIAGLRKFLPKRVCLHWPCAWQGTRSPDFLSTVAQGDGLKTLNPPDGENFGSVTVLGGSGRAQIANAKHSQRDLKF